MGKYIFLKVKYVLNAVGCSESRFDKNVSTFDES